MGRGKREGERKDISVGEREGDKRGGGKEIRGGKEIKGERERER